MAKSVRFVMGAIASAVFALGAVAQDAPESSPAPEPQNDALSKAAAVYGTYQGSVGDFKTTPFSSAKDIDRALTELGGHNAGQLSKGWLSYSGLVASQNNEFRAAINEAVGHYGRDRVLLGLKNNYAYARSLKGGNAAVGSALTALDADARRIRSAAAQVKEQAYTLQSAGWAKAKIGNTQAKANQIMANSRSGRPANGTVMSAMMAADADSNFARAGGSGAPSLWDGLTSAASTVRFPTISSASGYKRVRRGQEQTADRIATLAAYRAVGAGRSAESAILTTMTDQQAASCLNSASLNLQQCVAAAHKQYEVPFCIGEHALAEIGDCVGKVAQ